MSTWNVSAKLACTTGQVEQLGGDLALMLGSWDAAVRRVEPGDEDLPDGGVEVLCTLQADEEMYAVDMMQEALVTIVGHAPACIEIWTQAEALAAAMASEFVALPA